MLAQPVDIEFSAVILLRVKGKTVNVKGFSYPPAVPNNYPDAVARIAEHLKAIEDLIEANELSKVHGVAEKISHVCKKLPELAPEDDRAEIGKLCRETIALFSKIDEAADNGRKADTIKFLKVYNVKLSELMKHVKEDHH